MPDNGDDAHGDDGSRYVLYRLPDRSAERQHRESQRARRYADASLCALMGAMVLWSIGAIVFEVRYGDTSTVNMAILLLGYNLLAGWVAFTGGTGARGRFHRMDPANCSLALEDAERRRYGYGAHPSVAMRGLAPGSTPEYWRLSDLVDDLEGQLALARERMSAIAAEADPAPETLHE